MKRDQKLELQQLRDVAQKAKILAAAPGMSVLTGEAQQALADLLNALWEAGYRPGV